MLGIPLVADDVVDPQALRIAAEYVRQMLRNRPDVAETIAGSPVRLGVIGRNQQLTEMPEWSDLDEVSPEQDWSADRAAAASPTRPLTGAGEENLLCLEVDLYDGESIFVHEFAHTIMQFGLEKMDSGFRSRLAQAYRQGVEEEGLWEGTYAATNVDEYWAEAVQSYFNDNRSNDDQHNDIDTRAELRQYDPAVHEIVAEVFGDISWRPTCP